MHSEAKHRGCSHFCTVMPLCRPGKETRRSPLAIVSLHFWHLARADGAREISTFSMGMVTVAASTASRATSARASRRPECPASFRTRNTWHECTILKLAGRLECAGRAGGRAEPTARAITRVTEGLGSRFSDESTHEFSPKATIHLGDFIRALKETPECVRVVQPLLSLSVSFCHRPRALLTGVESMAETSAKARPSSALRRPSSAQGAVSGIKQYAALHAVQEEAVRKTHALTDVLRAEDEAKARRDYSDTTRSKVLVAAEQHLQAKQKFALVHGTSAWHGEMRPDMVRPDAASTSQPTTETVEEMVRNRKALLSAGFDAEAEKIQARLTQMRNSDEKERVDMEQRLFKQRISELEHSQLDQRESLSRTQAAEMQRSEAGWRDEIAALIAEQAKKNQEFELRVTRAAALEDVDLPPQLLKYRFRPSYELQGVRDKLAGLPEDLSQANRPSSTAPNRKLERTLLPAVMIDCLDAPAAKWVRRGCPQFSHDSRRLRGSVPTRC